MRDPRPAPQDAIKHALHRHVCLAHASILDAQRELRDLYRHPWWLPWTLDRLEARLLRVCQRLR